MCKAEEKMDSELPQNVVPKAYLTRTLVIVGVRKTETEGDFEERFRVLLLLPERPHCCATQSDSLSSLRNVLREILLNGMRRCS